MKHAFNNYGSLKSNLLTEVFLHPLYWLNTHHPIYQTTPPQHPTCIQSYHPYMLQNSLFCICGFFRPVVAYFYHYKSL